jgi:apolipoprotein N-acyltransferase
MAFGLFLTGVSWVYVSLSVFGGMPAALAGLATVLFCGLCWRFSRHWPARCSFASPRRLVAARPALRRLWVLAECLRAWVFHRFSVARRRLLANATESARRLCPLLGVHGVVAFFGAARRADLRGRQALAVYRPCGTRGWLRWCPALPLLAGAAILVAGDCCVTSAGRRWRASRCRWPCCRATWRRK